MDQHDESKAKRESVQSFACLVTCKVSLTGEVTAKRRVVKPARVNIPEDARIANMSFDVV